MQEVTRAALPFRTLHLRWRLDEPEESQRERSAVPHEAAMVVAEQFQRVKDSRRHPLGPVTWADIASKNELRQGQPIRGERIRCNKPAEASQELLVLLRDQSCHSSARRTTRKGN